MLKHLLLIIPCMWVSVYSWSQVFSPSDSLLGHANPYRTAYDVTHYALDVAIYPDRQQIKGEVAITFTAKAANKVIQIDLTPQLQLLTIRQAGKALEFQRIPESRAVRVRLNAPMIIGETYTITIAYQGRPKVAKHAPWDGGFVWTEDDNGAPWIGVACEGEGASIWWPCKDFFGDEPDSVDLLFWVPDTLVAVANGRLVDTLSKKEMKGYHWKVTHPINVYNVTINVAQYAHFSARYESAVTQDTLPLSYYVLPYNLAKAKQHFQQVKPMLACFEQKFGPYPFYEDSYKLVETPYLGMEHQSAIAYGNDYQQGYEGYDMSGIGFDYIIIHESGHEWFGNSITASDLAEIWIHESFTTYSESVYIECMAGKAAADRYLKKQRMMVRNQNPIVGPVGVHFDGWIDDNDQYYKGALMLHTFRSALHNDTLFWDILHEFSTRYAYQVIDTRTVINFFDDKVTWPAAPFFRQYLYHTDLPVFEYRIVGRGKDYKLQYRWKADVEGFTLPVKITIKKGWVVEGPVSTQWKTIHINGVAPAQIDFHLENYYIRNNGINKK